MNISDEIEVAEMKQRHAEAELRRLQLSVRDQYACAALDGLLAYGHRANKATWLYYHGTNPPFELRWERPEGTHQIGFHDQRGKAANKPTIGKQEANATPLEFRDELLRLATAAHNAEITGG